MELVVKGANLPIIYGKKLKLDLSVVHFIYPNRFYSYHLMENGDSIMVNNEAGLFKRTVFTESALSRYPVDTEYFYSQAR